MAYPLVKFTSDAAAAATVRLDLNTDSGSMKTYPDADTISLGSVELEGDPDALEVGFALRTITFDLIVKGTRAQADGQLSLLVRELLRDSNWLMYQQDATATPKWYKLFRSSPGEVAIRDVDNDRASNYWRIGVTLHAEPFAYGERVTLSTITVNNDPAAGSNPCFCVLPTINGDAPAPARVRIRYTNAQTGRRHMLASSPVPSTYTAPIVWPIGGTDGWTVGTDTSASTAGATYSGGSYRAVSFATVATLTNRISGSAPSSVPPGSYKVLARVARSDTSSTFSARFGATTGFEYIYGDTIPLLWNTSAASHAAWIDLGEFRFPQGNPLENVSGEANVTPVVALQAARLSGTGSLHLDSIMLVPTGDPDSRVLFVDYTSFAPSALLTDEYHDGDLEVVYGRSVSTGALSSMAPPGLEGGFTILRPGETNVLHFVEQTSETRAQTAGGTDAPDRIDTDALISVSYYPRYL